jgi:hypothetical protein
MHSYSNAYINRAGSAGLPLPTLLPGTTDTRNCPFQLASLDPGGRRNIPVKWYDTGACHGVFIPKAL